MNNWMVRLGRCLVAKEELEKHLAAWDPEMREKVFQTAQNQNRSLKFVDDRVIQDFNVSLWNFENTKFYMIALNSGNYNPFDPEIVAEKQPGTPVRPKELVLEILETLRTWARAYGAIVIGSNNTDKFKAYKAILFRYASGMGLKFRLVDPDNERFGYLLEIR